MQCIAVLLFSLLNPPTLVTLHVLIPWVLSVEFLHVNLYLWRLSKESDLRQISEACERHKIIFQNIKWYLLQILLYVLYFLMMTYLYIRDSCLKHQWFSGLAISMTTTEQFFLWANYLSFDSSSPQNWSVKLTNQFFRWICRHSSQK